MQEREADLVAREQAVERAAAEQQERQRAWTDSTRPPQVSFYILIKHITYIGNIYFIPSCLK